MEKLCILMDKYIKDEFVQKRFMASLGGFITEEDYIEEEAFIEELRAFVDENHDVRESVSLD